MHDAKDRESLGGMGQGESTWLTLGTEDTRLTNEDAEEIFHI